MPDSVSDPTRATTARRSRKIEDAAFARIPLALMVILLLWTRRPSTAACIVITVLCAFVAVQGVVTWLAVGSRNDT